MANYGLSLITAPTAEPMEPGEARLHLGITDAAYFSAEVAQLIEAARRKVESDTNRALITQTWDIITDYWPTGLDPIYLPKSPISSVTHVKYYDTAGAEQTLATSVYKVIATREPCEIRLKSAQSWTFLYSEPSIVTVRFVCGYGANSTFVPAGIKRAMALLMKAWFDPEQWGDGLENAYPALIEQYTVGDEFHCYAR